MNDRMWKIIEARNYWHRPFEATFPREITLKVLEYSSGSEAIYLFGPRQAGKTTVCLQAMQALSKKHGSESCLYVNFEEPAFSSMLNTEFLGWIVEKYSEVFRQQPKFVFFDEIQNVPEWEKFVRTIVDQKKFKIFVTGSSAKLLSSEFATSLGGRGLGFLVLPFSFREFKEVGAKKLSLADYLETGGYPAVVLEKNKEKRARLLEEYFETAIARDIAARYQIRDLKTLRTLAVYLLTNSGNKFTYNKLRALTGLSFETIKLYLSYLQDAFIAFEVPFFSYSMKKELEQPRKHYAYDTGLQAVISKSFSPDLGRRAENAVAIELIRREKEVQYYSNKYEVDFVVKEGLAVNAINVCYAVTAPKRETKAIAEFSEQFKPKSATLLKGEKEISEWLSNR